MPSGLPPAALSPNPTAPPVMAAAPAARRPFRNDFLNPPSGGVHLMGGLLRKEKALLLKGPGAMI